MTVLNTLLAAKLRILAAILFDRRKKYLVRNCAVLAVLLVMIFAAYQFFYNLIFRYVANLEDIGYLLIDRLVSVGFLVFFFLLVISSFILSLSSLFKSDETEYLFSTPASMIELFTSKYFDIIIFSSWAILIMAVPILYSYARVRDFGALEYMLSGVVVLLPFVLIATSFGTIAAIIMKYISKRLPLRTLILITTTLFIGAIYLVIKFSQPTKLQIQFEEDFRSLNLFINNFQLNTNPFIPNYWFIQSLRALVLKNYTQFILYASALITTAGMITSVLYYIVNGLYFRTWLISGEQFGREHLHQHSLSQFESGYFAQPARSQVLALFKKDAAVFLRDIGQWSQFLLIVALTALYFINLYFIPGDIALEQWKTILFVINFGFCGFVLATLAVRFIFPSISLEGGAFWVLSSAPLSPTVLFREKLYYSFTAFFIIAEIIGLISVSLLKLEPLYRILTFGGIFLMSISLSCLAVGFGAAFPDFSERSPSKIVSTPGGILTVVIALLYVGIMMALLTIPAYRYTLYLVAGEKFPLTELLISISTAVLINAGMIVIPLKIGANSFAKREFL